MGCVNSTPAAVEATAPPPATKSVIRPSTTTNNATSDYKPSNNNEEKKIQTKQHQPDRKHNENSDVNDETRTEASASPVIGALATEIIQSEQETLALPPPLPPPSPASLAQYETFFQQQQQLLQQHATLISAPNNLRPMFPGFQDHLQQELLLDLPRHITIHPNEEHEQQEQEKNKNSKVNFTTIASNGALLRYLAQNHGQLLSSINSSSITNNNDDSTNNKLDEAFIKCALSKMNHAIIDYFPKSKTMNNKALSHHHQHHNHRSHRHQQKPLIPHQAFQEQQYQRDQKVWCSHHSPKLMILKSGELIMTKTRTTNHVGPTGSKTQHTQSSRKIAPGELLFELECLHGFAAIHHDSNGTKTKTTTRINLDAIEPSVVLELSQERFLSLLFFSSSSLPSNSLLQSSTDPSNPLLTTPLLSSSRFLETETTATTASTAIVTIELRPGDLLFSHDDEDLDIDVCYLIRKGQIMLTNVTDMEQEQEQTSNDQSLYLLSSQHHQQQEEKSTPTFLPNVFMGPGQSIGMINVENDDNDDDDDDDDEEKMGSSCSYSSSSNSSLSFSSHSRKDPVSSMALTSNPQPSTITTTTTPTTVSMNMALDSMSHHGLRWSANAYAVTECTALAMTNQIVQQMFQRYQDILRCPCRSCCHRRGESKKKKTPLSPRRRQLEQQLHEQPMQEQHLLSPLEAAFPPWVQLRKAELFFLLVQAQELGNHDNIHHNHNNTKGKNDENGNDNSSSSPPLLKKGTILARQGEWIETGVYFIRSGSVELTKQVTINNSSVITTTRSVLEAGAHLGCLVAAATAPEEETTTTANNGENDEEDDEYLMAATVNEHGDGVVIPKRRISQYTVTVLEENTQLLIFMRDNILKVVAPERFLPAVPSASSPLLLSSSLSLPPPQFPQYSNNNKTILSGTTVTTTTTARSQEELLLFHPPHDIESVKKIHLLERGTFGITTTWLATTSEGICTRQPPYVLVQINKQKLLAAEEEEESSSGNNNNSDGKMSMTIKIKYAARLAFLMEQKDLLLGLNSNNNNGVGGCCPFISRLYSFFQTQKVLNFSLQLVQGCTLDTLLLHHREAAAADDDDMQRHQQHGGLPEDLARFYAAGVLDAIAFLHSKSILHRNLNPTNIVINHDGWPILVDVGILAKKLPPFGKTFTSCCTINNNNNSTGSNKTINSRLYHAPEMVSLVQGYDHFVDIWAFGVLLYEMIVGRNPFETGRVVRGGGNKNNNKGSTSSTDSSREESSSSSTSSTVEEAYKRILDADYTVPKSSPVVSFKAQNLISKILVKDPQQRMGCIGRPREDAVATTTTITTATTTSTGTHCDIRDHPFFAELDWEAYRAKDLRRLFFSHHLHEPLPLMIPNIQYPMDVGLYSELYNDDAVMNDDDDDDYNDDCFDVNMTDIMKRAGGIRMTMEL